MVESRGALVQKLNLFYYVRKDGYVHVGKMAMVVFVIQSRVLDDKNKIFPNASVCKPKNL